jgi:hypothetical protein
MTAMSAAAATPPAATFLAAALPVAVADAAEAVEPDVEEAELEPELVASASL